MDLASILKFLRLDNLVGTITGYVETRVELLKIEVREEASRVVSFGLMIAAYALLALLFLVFFSIGLANYMSEHFGTTSTGYWIVSGTYALLGLILISFRKAIRHSIENHLNEQAKHKKGK